MDIPGQLTDPTPTKARPDQEPETGYGQAENEKQLPNFHEVIIAPLEQTESISGKSSICSGDFGGIED